jgi:putative ABC transport system permease protein
MNIFRKGQGTFIKIISLSIGLTIGLVLIAKVQLERNYDCCIMDKEHVYELQETFQRKDQKPQQYGATPGGIAPVLAREIPEIQTATRYTGHFSEEKLTLENGQRHFFEEAVFADSCFFDIFATKVLQGDAKRVLSTAGQCIISRRLSEKIGGEVVGQTFCFASAPMKPMTIGGVFEDYPENSRCSRYDILMSMPSLGTYAWDGTENLIGNDRYHSYVRMHPDADMNKVRSEIKQLLQRILPWDDLKQGGYTDSSIELVSVVNQRMKDTTVRTTCIILSVVALVMLFTAVMNYILVVISLLVSRARQVALRKVLGAPRRDIYMMTLKEACIHLVVALAMMVLLLMAGKDWISELMGVGITTLFSQQTFVVLTVVCLIVLLCCGILPGGIYSRIPLTYAYRLYSESKRLWKLSLLAFQFVLSTMLLCVLSTIYRQYDYMLSKDTGYQYDRVAYVNVSALHGDSIYSLAREIERLPCVEKTAASYSLFCERQNGDNVLVPGNPQELFNCANLFFAEEGLVETMGLEIVRGRDFKRVEHSGWMQEMLVDERFAQMMKEVAGIDDVIGRQFVNSSVGDEYPFTVVGVVKSFMLGSLISREERPMMVANGNVFTHYIMIKLQDMTSDNLQAVQQLCDRFYPDADLCVKPYAAELATCYNDTRHTRDMILIGCLASLLITLIGLIGYVRDEVQRRSRELAIRKVMGASMKELQSLFLRSIAFIAFPSVVIGVALGWYFSRLLMEQFADKIPLLWYVFAADAILVLLIIGIVAYLQTRRVANNNPIDYLKTE